MANWQQTYEQLKKRKKEVDKVKNTSEIKQIDKKLSNNRMSVMEYDVSNNVIPMFERLPNTNFNTTAKPLSTSSKKDEKKWYQKFFKGSDAFDDGYDVGDITKTILGTAADLENKAAKGVVSIFEAPVDILSYGAYAVSDKLGADKTAKKIKKFADRSLSTEAADSWTKKASILSSGYNTVNTIQGNYENVMKLYEEGKTEEARKEMKKFLKDSGKGLLGMFTTSPNGPSVYETTGITEKLGLELDEKKLLEEIENDSVSGDTLDKTAELVGYVLSMGAATKGLDAAFKGTKTLGSVSTNVAGQTIGSGVKLGASNIGVTVAGKTLNLPTLAVAGGMSSGLNEAYQKEDVTHTQAWTKGLTSGAIEGVTEGLFGMLGVGGNELTDQMASGLAKKFSSSFGKQVANFTAKGGGEAFEELASYTLNWLADNNIIDKMDGADFKSEFDLEEVSEQMALALISSGALQGSSTALQVNAQVNEIVGAKEQELGRKLTKAEKKAIRSEAAQKIIDAENNQIENQEVAPVQEQVNEQVQEQVQTPVQEVAPVEAQTQNVEDIDNQIAVLEEQLMATENEAEYQRLSTQIQELEQQANQMEQQQANQMEQQQANQMEQQQEIAPIKAASVEEISQPTTQETNSNSLVEVESNTQEVEKSPVIEEKSPGKTGTVETNIKQKQLDVILKENPMTDDYHTGIRTIEDIKTFDEVINDDESFVWGDFSQEDAKKALEKGEVTVYSSYPIEQGVFVSTSKNQAQDYAGGGKVYSKTVPLNEVAWINGDEGQYARVEEQETSSKGQKNESKGQKQEKNAQNIENNVQSDTKSDTETQQNVKRTTPTQEELDNLEYVRKNKSGSEYASEYYALGNKYGTTNLYKALNNYKSTGKALTEDIAPIKNQDLKDVKTLEQRVSGDDLLDAQDLIEEVKSVGGEVDDNGYITVYHQTTTENAQKIKETGKMTSKELDVFFSTSKNAQQSESRGQTKLEFKIPAEKLVLDDIFTDNVDVKIPLNGKKSIDVSEYLVTRPDIQDDIAPIKAELTDLTKDLKSTIKDTKKELKALKTELNEVKEEINDVVEEYKSMTVTELPGYQQQGVDSIRSIPDSEIDDMVAPVREETNYLQDEITIDDKYAKLVAKNTKDILGLNNKQGKGLEDVIKNNVNSTEDQIYEELNNKYSELGIEHQLEDVKEIKRVLRGTRIKVSEQIKDDITDYAYLKQKNFGKIRFSNDGMQVDQVYEELSETYPDFFPSDISNPTDQLLKMIDVANESITLNDSLILPDETLQEAAELIYSGIQDYKETAHKKSYQEYEKMWASTLDDIAPYDAITEPITNETTQDNVITPVQDLAIEQAPIEEIDNGGPMLKVSPEMEVKTPQVKTDTETPALEGNKNLSVKESNALKLKNLEISLKQYNYDAEQSLNSFNELIAEKKRQYNALKNKNTQKANNVLQQINRITAQRDNTQIEYERKMNNLEKRIDKMNSVDFKRAEQRMTKQEEYRKQANELIGDTSTWTDKKLGIQYQINTLKRNLRDIVKGVDGKADIQRADAIYNEYQGKYDINEADLKVEYNRLAEPFRNRKLTRQEEVYTQMLGEFKYNPDTTIKRDAIDGYYNKYKNKIDVDKVNQTIEDARKLYDELFERINDRLRKQGMKELEYRRGYFPHFTEEKQSMLAKLFDWKVKNDQIPTDIAGLTELNNPERSWQSFNKHREGDTTDYNFSKGFDTYVHGALDWIYHIEDIQKRRALENEIRYQHSEEGVKKKIEEIYNNPDLDADEVQTQIEAVYGVAKNPLNNFVTDLRNSTNNLAGKKSTLDRSLEYATNRQIYSTVTNLSNRVSGNMIGGSISSALTNFIPITQSWSQVSPVSSLKALGETIKSSVKDDGTIAKSTFLTNRLVKAESLYKSNWDKAADKVGIMTDAIDSITSQVVWRAKYNENIKAGMSEMEAIKDADQFAEGVIAGRSRGNEPTLFNSKNPITKMFTAFQLEVNNQYHYMFKDMPTDIGSKSKAKLIKGYATMFLGAYAYNALYSSLVGRDVAFDPIGLLEGFLKELGIGGDDEEENEKTASEKFTAITEDLVQQIPFVGGLFGGGRVPISAAIPYENPIEMVKGTATDLLDALDEEKREKSLKNLTSEWLKPVTYLALPFGGGQINKTYQGLSMYDDELPIAGSYTNSGDLRFTADESTWGKVQAGLFGRWASDSAQEYVDSGFKTVKKNNIDEMLDLDMTSTEYRKYRNGLSKAIKKAKDNDDLTQTQAAADYIEGLDVSDSQKAIMLENYFKSNLDEEAEKELDALNMTADAKFSYFTAKSKIGSLENDYKNNVESLKKKYGEDSDEYEEKAETLAKEKQEKVIDEVLNSSLNDEEKKYLYSKYYSSEKALNEITDTGTSMDTYLNFVKDTMYFTADLDDDGKTISGSLNNKYEKYLLDSDLLDEEKTALYEYGVLSGYDNEDKYKDYKTLKSAGVDINSWLDFDSQEFEADYKSNGKAISGSKKNKVISYVNSLDLLIPQKAMMIRTKYTSFDDYNNDIVDYVVDLNIDYEEKVFIIEALDMKVSDDGTVSW